MDARNNNFDFDFTPIGQAIKCAYRKAECEAAALAELKSKCEKNGWDYQQKHFTHNGRHYLLTSGMMGYIPNPSEVAVSDDPLGPYMPIGNPHRNDSNSASFNSQVSFIFQAPHWGNFYLVMADRWVPKYVVTRERYQQILRVVAHQSDKSYKPKLADYLAVASAPFLGTANTSIAEYVWLPMRFEGEMPVIDWHDEWTVDELADNLRELRKTN